MAMRKLLLLLKPFDVYPVLQSDGVSRITNPQVFRYLQSRLTAHRDAVKFCQEILHKKSVNWEPIIRNRLSQPIRGVDLVVTVGGDGTLLQAGHFIDDSTPILGVNSDPTQAEEVEEYRNQFDATRSTGYLCAATVQNFEKVLDDIIHYKIVPSQLSRIFVRLNSKPLPRYTLNDILISHPCPAAVSRFSFQIKRDDEDCSSMVHCRCSGLRVSTAAGSTAAMLSAGGFTMPILSRDLQYMVREPITPGDFASLMHGYVRSDESMTVTWFSKDGFIYIDGSHIFYSVESGDTIEISPKAPQLNIFLPHQLLS